MWVQLGGSLIAILLLAGLARVLKLGRAAPITNHQAICAEAEAMLSGFEAADAIIGRDGATALVHGRDGSIAAIKRHGAHLAARRVGAEAVRETPDGWHIDTGDARFGAVLVRR